MKASDVMKTQVDWLKNRCKEINKQIHDESAIRKSAWYEDHYVDQLKAKLEAYVEMKVSTEKYMKKLRHEGN